MICVTTGDTNRFIAEFLLQAGKERGMGDSRRGTFGYFMVFDKKPMEGAYAFEDFMDMVRDV